MAKTADVSGNGYDKAGNVTSVTDGSGTGTGITWSDFWQIKTESLSAGRFQNRGVYRLYN